MSNCEVSQGALPGTPVGLLSLAGLYMPNFQCSQGDGLLPGKSAEGLVTF